MRSILILLFVFLAGCAALPERPAVDDPEAAWTKRQEALMRVDAWDMRGRLALRTKEQGAHATVRWVHERGVHRIDLAGPFGGGRARVSLDPRGAELRDASGKVYRDVSAEDLLERATGWRLPLESLRYWIVGLPSPAAPARVELDDWGRLKAISQEGWEIRYAEYAPQGAYELPRRMFVERGAGSEAEIEVRMAVEQWIVSEAGAAAR